MRKRRTFVSRMLALLLAAAMIVTGAPVTTLAAVQEETGFLNDLILDEDEGMYDEDEEATPSNASSSDADRASASDADEALSEEAREFIRRVNALDREKILRLAGEYIEAVRYQSAVGDDENASAEEWESACALVLEKEEAFGREWEPVLSIESELYDPLSETEKETDAVQSAWTAYTELTTEVNDRLYRLSSNDAVPSSLIVDIKGNYSSFNKKILPIGIQLKYTTAYKWCASPTIAVALNKEYVYNITDRDGDLGNISSVTLKQSYANYAAVPPASYGWFFYRNTSSRVYIAPVTNASLKVYAGTSGTGTREVMPYTPNSFYVPFHVNFSGDAKTYMSAYSMDIKNTANLYLYQGSTLKDSTSVVYRASSADDQTFGFDIAGLPPGTYTVKATINNVNGGDSLSSSTNTTLEIYKATYSGPTTQTDEPNGGVITNRTVTLPTPPTGSSYGTPTFSAPVTAASVSGTTLTYSTTAVDSTMAPTITIPVSGTNYNNYNYVVTINPQSMPVTISGVAAESDLVYDGTEKIGYTGTAVGTLPDGTAYTGDIDTVWYQKGTGDAWTELSGKPQDAGDYKVTFSVPASAGSYKGSLDVPFTIAPKELTVTNTEIATREYDGTTNASFLNTPAPDGVVGSDDVILGGGTPAFKTNGNAGTNKEVELTTDFTISGADVGNYTLTQPTGLKGTIAKKSITVAPGTYKVTKPYDGTTAPGTASGALNVTGILTADSAVKVEPGTIPAYTNANVGTYTLALPISISGDTNGNYKIANNATSVNVSAKITAVAGAVTNISDLSKPYDGTAVGKPTFTSKSTATATVEYKKSTETDNAYTTTAPKTVGDYIVRVTVPTDGNYAQASNTANFTISQKEVTISGTTVAATRVYNATTVAEITSDGTLSANYDGSNLTIKRGTASYADKNVGDNKPVTFAGFELDGSAKDNYRLTGQPTATRANITKKTITVSGTAIAGKVYDGTTTATLSGTRTLNGVESGDTVSLSDGTVEFADKNVGTGKTVNVTGDFTLTGTDAGNYTLTQPSNLTGTITVCPVTISGTTVRATKEYDGNTNAYINNAGTVSPNYDGANLTITTGSATYNDKTVGTGKTVAFRGFALGGSEAGNYKLSGQPAATTAAITAKALTVTNTGIAEKVYDGAVTARFSGTPQIVGKVESDTVTLTNGTPTFADKNVGTNKPVTSTNFTIGGADAGNYKLTQPTGLKGTITKKSITVAAGTYKVSKLYDGTTAPGTASGALSVTGILTADSAVKVEPGTIPAYSDSVAKSDYRLDIPISITGDTSGNYKIADDATTVNVPAEISQTAGQVTNIEDLSKTYDGQPVNAPTFTKKGTGTATIKYRKQTEPDSAYTTTEPKDAGDYTVKVSVAADNNYAAASATANFTISKKEVTINGTTVAATRVYDATKVAEITNDGTLSANYDGSHLTIKRGTASYDNKNVGDNKPVTFNGFELEGSAKDNYTLKEQPAATRANITKKTITVSGTAIAEKVYDGTTTATLSGTRTLNGVETDDDVSLSDGTVEFENKNVGTGKRVNVTGDFTLTGTDAGNYTLTQPSNLTGTIKVCPVTISGTTVTGTRVYNGLTSAYIDNAGTVSPNYDGANLTITTGSATYNDKTVGTGKTVTFRDFALGGSEASNYTLTAQPAATTAAITAKELTVTSTEIAEKVYDGDVTASFSGTPEIVGKVESDTVTLTNGTPTFADKNVGTDKPVTSTDFTIGGADAGNYTLTQPTGLKGTITKKSITVAAGTYKVSKPYDGTTAPGTASGALSVTGILDADKPAVSVTTGDIPAYSDSAAKSDYRLDIPISITGDTSGNYKIADDATTVNVPGEISQTAGQVTNIQNLSKTYDGQSVSNPTFDSPSSKKDEATFAYKKSDEGDNAYSSDAPKDAGSYTVKVTVPADDNYAEASATANFTISKKKVTISGTTVAATRVYDATTVAEITDDGTLSANYDGSNLTIKRGTASYDNKNVGDDKTVSFAGFALEGSAKDNYKLTAQPTETTANITKKTITVSGTAIAAKVYDGTTTASLSGTRTLNGVETDDDVSLSDGTVEFADKNVGTGKTVNVTGDFTLTGTDAGNYTLTQPSNLTGTIKVCPVTISGTTVTGTRVYNGLTSAYIDNAGTVSPNYDGANLTITTGSATYNDKTVGTGKTVTFRDFALGGSEASNYELTGQPTSVTAEITAKELTVTSTEIAEKVYDGGVTASFSGTPQIVGKVDGDTVDLTNGTPTFADKNVGTNKPVTSTNFTIGGADAGNYKLTQPTGLKGTITKKSITVAAGTYKVSKPYDTTTAAGTASGELSVTGILDADKPAVSVTTGDIPAYSDSVAKSDYRLDIPISITGDDTYHNYTIANVGSIVNVPAEIIQTTGEVTNIQNLSKTYDGQSVSNPTFDSPSSKKDEATFAYKKSDEGDEAYTGAAPKDAGSYTVKVTVLADDNYAEASATANFTISKKAVTISGTSVATTRVYDATTVAEITDDGTLSANYDGSDLTIKRGTASYDNKNVGDDKTVSFAGFELGGSAKDNYTLTEQPAETTAKITKKTITVSGTAIAEKVYDGTTTATLSGTRTLNGVETGDTVSLSDGTVEFADKNVGTEKTVNVKADALFTLTGTDAGNYTLTQPSNLTGTITVCPVTISGTTVTGTRVYNGLTSAYIDNAGTVSPNYDGANLTITTGSANYNDKTVGTGKTVTFRDFALGGSEASNYELSAQPTSVTAEITEKELTVSLTVADKYYDGTTAASYKRTPELNGKVEGDTVDLTNGTPTFADAAVGENKTINFTAFSISGGDATNYTLTQPTGITATIKPYTAVKGTDYTTNAPADGGWQNTDFIVSGKNGCKVSTTNTVDGTWSDTLTESTETANGSITFYVKKPDGVISEAVTESYKLDKTAPVGTVALDGDSWSSFNAAPTFGSHLFNRGNSPKTLNVSANGGLSGIRETSWLKVSAAAAPPTPLTEAQLNARTSWTKLAGASEGTIQTTASTDGEYAVYYIRMTDNAGNTSYITTAGFTIDTVAPTIAGAGNGKTYYTTRQLTVTEKNLASVKVNNTAISAPYTLTGDTNATYNVVAADEVRNTATLTVTMKPIASLSESIRTLTAGNVKSTDRDAVRAVQDDIARVRTDTAGATEAELAKLAAAADNTVNLLNKIAETEAKLSRAEQALKKYSIEQVKSSDEAALSDIYRVITSLTGGDNLTGPQRRSMEDLESRAAAMLARIREVREKREALLSERTGVNSYSTSVVNGAHRDEIRDLAAVAEELLATSNLTSAERKSVKAGLERAEKLLADIRAVVETTLPRAIRSMGATEDTTEADVTAVIEQVFAGTGIRVEIGEYERKKAKILGVSAMLETTLTLHYGESPETGETVVRAYLKWKNSGKSDPIEPDGGWHISEKAGVDSTSRITADKGRVDSKLGIVTTDDSYTVHSRWEATELTGDGKTDTRWRLRYANGTYAAGSMEPDENGVMRENLAWELVNGNWWAFGADSYVVTGWVYDRNYNGWFYIDEKRGAMLGWNLIDGKWYYFEPERGKNQGRRKENDFVDGYYLGSDGSWDGKEKKDND